jgi:beta-galactosidase
MDSSMPNNVIVMKIKIFSCLLLFFSMIHQLKAQLSFGEPVKINSNWQFHLGDCNALQSDASISWRQIDLPHDWSSEGELKSSLSSCTGYLPGGIGWYRKDLLIPANRANDKVYLYFEGVYNHSEVYINGHLLGKRPNGYISFAYDATPYVTFGSNNSVIVRVDHSKSADSRWYTGSGIYRDVWLIYANPVHFAQWGTTCITQSVTSGEAKLKIDAELENGTNHASELAVRIQLVDKDGKVSGSSTDKVTLEANKHKTSTVELNISNPKLWNIEHPYLYTLKATISDGHKVIDQVNIPVGIRSMKFDPNKGFALNDQPMKIKGVCIHHDAGVLGSAVPKAVWERRLLALKQAGCNAIRLSHNPQAPALYNLCDQLGLLVLDEAFDEWEFAKRKWLTGWNHGTPGY